MKKEVDRIELVQSPSGSCAQNAGINSLNYDPLNDFLP